MPRPAARPARAVGHLLAGVALALPILATPALAAPDQPPAAPTEEPGDPMPGDGSQQEDPTDPGTDAEPTGDPLEVRIDGLDPAVVPESGTVTVRGTVTNLSDEPWTELAAYVATSGTVITTPAGLREAETSPSGVEPADYQRIVEPGRFELIGDLAPGESTDFALRVPRDGLGIPDTPGVYRLGVQVLGTEPAGRIDGADGRDRLLVTVPPRVEERTEIAVALQLRRRTTRTPTGEVDRVAGWERVLSETGRLRHLLGLLASSRRYPVDVVLDPAVVETVGSLAAGNPGFDLTTSEVAGVQQIAPDPGEEPPSTDAPEPSAQPTSGSADETGSADGGDPDAGDIAAASELATAWLQRLARLSERLDVQALPYGDLDVGAAVRHGDPDLLGRSLSSGISLLSAFGIQSSGVLAPHHGLLGETVAAAAPQGVPALVSERTLVQAVVDEDGTEVLDTPAAEVPAALLRTDDSTVWTYRTLRVGDGATGDDSALALRQRILARTAVQTLARPGEAFVAVLPPQWQPGAAWREADFFTGLREAPWLAPRRLDELTPRGPRVVGSGPGEPGTTEPTSALALRLPEAQLGRELPPVVLRASQRLVRKGQVLGDLVVDGDPLAPLVARQAMLGASIHSRGHVRATVARLRATDNVLGALVRDVEVQAPRFVRMSSEVGSFLVPVVNQLDVPVQVQLEPVVAESGLRLEVPDPVVVGPGARRPIRVEATAETIGIRSVQLDLATVTGDRLYPGPSLAIRSSQVARWVWVAMAVGGGILFGTILVRIVRRVRRREVRRGPEPPPPGQLA